MDTFTHGWGMGFGWIIPFFILGLLFYFLQDKKEPKSSAQDILDKRYASGGIDKKEYEEKSKHLREQTLKG